MIKNQGFILKYYLSFSLILLLLFSSNTYAQAINSSVDTSASVVLKDKIGVEYPGKPLLLSLIIPGMGQYYNKDRFWKVATFSGIEIASLFSYYTLNKRADEIKNDFQNFADQNWTLNNWVTNKMQMANSENNGRLWSQFESLNNLKGSHDLILVLDGSLKENYGSFVSSDSLEKYPQWANSPEVSVARDRHFYENVGKYDQFLGGWSDANSDWFWEEKDVGDTIEIIIKTPNKNKFLNMRKDSNDLLNYAKFSISVIMFNHLLSGIDAVISSQKHTTATIHTKPYGKDFNLIYNPDNPFGIGGFSMSIRF
tara:strand:- start:12401 stop:13333 length:933 start_codon:yes stop_codon:yes gene_type:complete